MHRRRFLTVLVAAPLALRGFSARAGGWAVIRLAEPIPTVFAGDPVTIRFYNYPHDMKDHALPGLPISVVLKNKTTGDATRFSSPASETDDRLYEIDLLIDEPGAYKWNIQAEPFSPTAMPTLHVLEPGSSPATPIPVIPSGDIAAEVSISHEAFMPASVTVALNEAVRWTNNDHMVHQVAWQDLQLDDSALIEPASQHTVTFDTAGEYGYYCGPHPWMTGVVVVTENESATPQR